MSDDAVIFELATAGRVLGATRRVEALVRGRRGAAAFSGRRTPHARKSIRDIRWNSDSKTIQVTFVSDPGESDWEDKITFGPCST